MDVGFIGVGQMGAPMVRRLLDHGFAVHLFDRVDSAIDPFREEAEIHISPRSVADACAIVLTSLPSAKISREVMLGREDGLCRGKRIETVIETSTIGPMEAAALAQDLGDFQIALIDSPVSGGPAVARDGELTFMIAGASAAIKSARPIFECLGGGIFELGEVCGQAQRMKLVNNIIMAGNALIAAEGLNLIERLGIDLQTAIDVIARSSGASAALGKIMGPEMVSGRFAFGAGFYIIAKDMGLGLEMARANKLWSPMLDQANRIWQAAQATPEGQGDYTEIARIIGDAPPEGPWNS